MATELNLKNQIYQMIESMPIEQLPDLLQFVRQFPQQPAKSEPTSNIAPIYQLHQHAVDTGISDLAAQHDHYIYGTSKDDV